MLAAGGLTIEAQLQRWSSSYRKQVEEAVTHSTGRKQVEKRLVTCKGEVLTSLSS